MKYLDLHLKENFIRQTSFLQKSTPSKSPCLLGLNKKKSFGLFLFSFFHFQGPSKYPRIGQDEMALLKKTMRSTEKVLEKFAKYEEVKTRKRNKLIQKGIDFFMDTLERTQAIEQNPKKEIVK